MKKKFSKILGVGLTLALVTSLLLVAAPVSADVSQPTVDVDPDEISDVGEYTISFRIHDELIGDQTDGSPTITVRFPEDTDVDDAVIDSVSYTSGIGFNSGDVSNLTIDTDQLEDLIVEITLGEFTYTATPGPNEGIGAMAYVQVVISGVTNPTDTGTYTLEVKTSAETDYVESEEYDIDAPTVGGFVYVYNPSNILLATFGGKGALDTAYAAGHFAKKDYTIKVGPGSYDVNTPIVITGEGLTLESSAGAEDTIIDASGANPAISINADDVTVDGFTVEDALGDGIAINYATDGAIVKNNIITEAAWSGIVLVYDALLQNVDKVVTGATVTGNVIEDSTAGINLLGGAKDNTISGNTITGSSAESLDIHGGTLDNPTEGNTITGNTITANQTMGIRIKVEYDLPRGTNVDLIHFKDNVIEGNTISENEGEGILFVITGNPTITIPGGEDPHPEIDGLEILDNYIADNEEDGILIADNTWHVHAWVSGNESLTDPEVVTNVIKFNTITGNDDGIITDEVVDATFNWWGTTVADDIDDMVSEDVTYEPFLTDTAEAAIAGGKAAGNTSSLDAKDEAGVKVSGVLDDSLDPDKVADIISAVKFTANPEEAIDDAIAFYDVYVVLETDFDTDDVIAKVKFYDGAITTGSTANFWTGDFWAECSDQEARDGIIYVTISDITLPALDELEETIFAVVAGEAVAELDAPVIAAPESGAEDVSLKPTLAWGTVADAIGYDFELADNPLFVMPMASLTGDLGRLITPFYQQVAELDYSKYYYWRVKAVSADAESVWSAGVFMTVAIAEPEEAEVWMCSEGLTFDSRAALEAHLATAEAHQPVEPADIVIEPPDVVLPAETPITPAWIYVIIGVGAVLVIGLIVLIVRTRRVA